MKIANSKVFRILVNTRSLSDVLFTDAYRKLKIDSGRLSLIRTPLYGFFGECFQAEGMITLPVMIGTTHHQIRRMIDFLVVDKHSLYNSIIGGSTLNAIKAIISTYHLMMKFSTENGIGTL